MTSVVIGLGLLTAFSRQPLVLIGATLIVLILISRARGRAEGALTMPVPRPKKGPVPRQELAGRGRAGGVTPRRSP